MPIKRLRELKCDEGEVLVSVERRRQRGNPRRVFSPHKAILFWKIADLRRQSGTNVLEGSKRLIEKSRRLIFETEISLTKND